MESGTPPDESSDTPQDPPRDAGTPASPQAPAPGGQTPPQAPQAPAPQAPRPQAPAGPQAPGPGSPPPVAHIPVGPGGGPEAPPQAPSYGGPMPPGGWQQSVARPEGWSGGVPLAGWGSRVGAALIDGLVLVIPAGILFFVVVGGTLGSTGGDDAGSIIAVLAASALYAVLVAAVILVYAPVLMARDGAHNGQTWGKQAMGIRVVRDNGESMSFGYAALREVAVKGLGVSVAGSFTFGLAYFADVLWPLWDDQNRALHDLVVSTHVVRA